jgi:hypothetical protein
MTVGVVGLIVQLQDTQCYATSCGGKQQSIADMNKCAGLKKTVDENIGDDVCTYHRIEIMEEWSLIFI